MAPAERLADQERDFILHSSRGLDGETGVQGESSVFKKDKQAMTHELGIQIRDLRLLDPLMTSTYPSAILCRDKALIINLE